MTGWRIGYIGAPEWIAKACTKLIELTSGQIRLLSALVKRLLRLIRIREVHS